MARTRAHRAMLSRAPLSRFSQNEWSESGWTLIYYTGKRRLMVDRKLPETLCIFFGRPVLGVVVREIIASIDLGAGLPEAVIAESKVTRHKKLMEPQTSHPTTPELR